MPGGDVADARRMRHFRVCGNLVRLCWYVARMRLSPILPVGLAVAAVALSASLGNTVAEPDKRGNHEVVAFPLFALKSSDRILSSNNHYSHESHSSHESHFSHQCHLIKKFSRTLHISTGDRSEICGFLAKVASVRLNALD